MMRRFIAALVVVAALAGCGHNYRYKFRPDRAGDRHEMISPCGVLTLQKKRSIEGASKYRNTADDPIVVCVSTTEVP